MCVLTHIRFVPEVLEQPGIEENILKIKIESICPKKVFVKFYD